MRIGRSAQSLRQIETLARSFATIVATIRKPSKRSLGAAERKIDALFRRTSTKTKLLTAARASVDLVSKRLPKQREDAARLSPKKVRSLLGEAGKDAAVRKEMNRFATEAAESLKSYATDEVKRIGVLLKKSVRESWTQDRLSKEVRSLTSVTHKKAAMAARNLTRTLHIKASVLMAKRAGVERFRWVHSGNANPRPEHVARDGKIYSLEDPPPDMPGEYNGCGCEADWLVDEESEAEEPEVEAAEEEEPGAEEAIVEIDRLVGTVERDPDSGEYLSFSPVRVSAADLDADGNLTGRAKEVTESLALFTGANVATVRDPSKYDPELAEGLVYGALMVKPDGERFHHRFENPTREQYETANRVLTELASSPAPADTVEQFRGMNLPADAVDLIQSGREFDLRAISSWTSAKDVAEAFAKEDPAVLNDDRPTVGGQPVLFKLKPKRGREITPLSTYRGEAEFITGGLVRIVRVEVVDGVVVVEVEQD